MPRILIVDDDKNILRSLGRLIHFMPKSALGGEAVVECFDDAEAALERAAATEFDLVIVDYLMPKMHGVAWLRRLDAVHSHAARIILSGHARVLEKIDATRGLSPTELVSKPWDDAQLCATIARLVQWRRERLNARPAS
jgi:DNA-binding NtrC family response regulator